MRDSEAADLVGLERRASVPFDDIFRDTAPLVSFGLPRVLALPRGILPDRGFDFACFKRALTSCSLRIECQPGTPLVLAICARSFDVRDLRVAAVINRVLLFDALSHR